MKTSEDTVVNISHPLQDVLLVEIDTNSLNEQYEYSISDLENKIVRKGYFRAPLVQLRTSFMKEGQYLFHLYKAGKECFTATFEKFNSIQLFESRLAAI